MAQPSGHSRRHKIMPGILSLSEKMLTNYVRHMCAKMWPGTSRVELG